MNAYEFEQFALQWGLEKFKYPKGKFLLKGFSPLGVGVADFSIIKVKTTYHIFHIERRAKGFPLYPGNEIYFGHITTENFIEWQVHKPVVFITPGAWDGEHIWAPYVLKWNKKFYMFYTGVNKFGSQSIGVSISNDLFSWKKYKHNPVFHPGKWAYWKSNKASPCRDPHIFFENKKFYMLYTAAKKTGETAIGIAESKNLLDWKDIGPIYTKYKNYTFPYKDIPAHAESSCVHKFNNKYYLFVGIDGGIRFFLSNSLSMGFNSPGYLLIPGQTSLELIERFDSKGIWVVATFGLYDNKLYLYYIDFNKKIPKAYRIKNKKKLESLFKL